MRSKIWNYGKHNACDPEVGHQTNEKALVLLWTYMALPAVDLHTHSNVSDGKSSPPQLLQELLRTKVSAFALTDHDSIEGIEVISMLYEKLIQVQVELPEFVPGVELSVDYLGDEVHLLAYYPAGQIRCLEAYLEQQRARREIRNRLLCEKVTAAGMPVDYRELSGEGGGVIGRVHMAQLLIRKGYVTSLQEAFERFLADDRSCYVRQEHPPIEEAIRVIRRTGGVPVLAHPAIYKGWLRSEGSDAAAVLGERLARLKEAGLQGVEVYHGQTSPEESAIILEQAAALDLLPTAGSDYHGSHKPNVRLRTFRDDCRKALMEAYPGRFNINK